MNKKPCKNCGAEFEVLDEDKEFYDKVSPIIDGEKFLVPEPTHCPDCRLQRRLVWRNERSLYRRKCDATGEMLISWIAPDKPHKVYKKDIWWGDSWNARDYGRDFDFSKPFFQQFKELLEEVPLIDLLQDNSFNSDYVNFCNNNKDCYLLYASNNNEGCQYSGYLWDCKDCLDCMQGFDCELCYSSVDISNCYECKYVKNCVNCTDCVLCESCRGCQNCFGCVNLVNKEYCFFNEKLTKEEYEKKIAESNLEKAKELFSEYRLKFPMKYAQLVNCEDCTGDVLRNSKNVKAGFDTSGARDCKWVMICSKTTSDCYDVTGTEDVELEYEIVASGVPASRTLFSAYVWKGVNNVLYSVLCPGSKNCFGSVGLHGGRYCILNKQYSEQEYNDLVKKIIRHMQETEEWGEFFPINVSPFDYNETIANDYFPLTKERVLGKGWRWRDPDKKDFQPATNEICACEDCGKNYKINEAERKFYKNHRIPAPKKCPDCRYNNLLKQRNPRHLWQRTCAKCGIGVETTYSPDHPEIVYCEKCYLETVY